MRDRRWTFMIAVLLTMGILIFRAGPAHALHKSGHSIDCNSCHAMHQAAGQDGGYANTTYYNQFENWDTTTSIGGDRKLLKGRRSSWFCLQCHQGNPSGPDRARYVVNFAGTNGKPSIVGSGGYFYGMSQLPTLGAGAYSSGYAHNLDTTITGFPESSLTAADEGSPVLWCRSCHHHHGTNNGGSGLDDGDTHAANLPHGDPLEGKGLKISEFRNLIVPEGDNNVVGREIAGDYTNTYYVKGMELFCERCHNLAGQGPTSGYHPVGDGTTISTGDMTAGTNYVSGMDDTDTITGQPIIKPQDPSGNDNRTAALGSRDPGYDDQVTCLTCHYAHGGPYPKMVRWGMPGYGQTEYTWTDGGGDTMGIGNANGPGCQMCHAR